METISTATPLDSAFSDKFNEIAVNTYRSVSECELDSQILGRMARDLISEFHGAKQETLNSNGFNSMGYRLTNTLVNFSDNWTLLVRNICEISSENPNGVTRIWKNLVECILSLLQMVFESTRIATIGDNFNEQMNTDLQMLCDGIFDACTYFLSSSLEEDSRIWCASVLEFISHCDLPLTDNLKRRIVVIMRCIKLPDMILVITSWSLFALSEDWCKDLNDMLLMAVQNHLLDICNIQKFDKRSIDGASHGVWKSDIREISQNVCRNRHKWTHLDSHATEIVQFNLNYFKSIDIHRFQSAFRIFAPQEILTLDFEKIKSELSFSEFSQMHYNTSCTDRWRALKVASSDVIEKILVILYCLRKPYESLKFFKGGSVEESRDFLFWNLSVEYMNEILDCNNWYWIPSVKSEDILGCLASNNLRLISKLCGNLLTFAKTDFCGRLDLRSIDYVASQYPSSETISARDSLSGIYYFDQGLPDEIVTGMIPSNSHAYQSNIRISLLVWKILNIVANFKQLFQFKHSVGYLMPLVLRLADNPEPTSQCILWETLRSLMRDAPRSDLQNFEIPLTKLFQNHLPLFDDIKTGLRPFLQSYTIFCKKVHSDISSPILLDSVDRLLNMAILQYSTDPQDLGIFLSETQELVKDLGESVVPGLENWMKLLVQSMESIKASTVLSGLEMLSQFYESFPKRLICYTEDITCRLSLVILTYVELQDYGDSGHRAFRIPTLDAMNKEEMEERDRHRNAIRETSCRCLRRIASVQPALFAKLLHSDPVESNDIIITFLNSVEKIFLTVTHTAK